MKRSRPFKKRQKLNQKNHHPSWNQSPPGMPMSWLSKAQSQPSNCYPKAMKQKILSRMRRYR
jgi:hypothetical protein